MNDNNFFHLFNDIDDSFIDEADDARGERVYLEQKHSRFKQGIGITAGAAACFAILAGAVYLSSGGKSLIDTGSPSAGQLAPGTVITEDGYRMFTDEHGNTVKLKGEPMEPDKLWHFGRVQPHGSAIFDDAELNDFLLSEGISDEIHQAYILASELGSNLVFANIGYADENESTDDFLERLYGTFLTDSENKIIYVPSFIPKFDTELIVSMNETEIIYNETGISYDSFFEALCGAYTEEAAMQMLESGGAYYEYGGELWCADYASRYKNNPTTAREYEVTVNTDNEFAFTTTYYILSARDSVLSSTSIESRFVKTDEGWRAVSVDLGGISSLDSFKTEAPDNSKDVTAAEDGYTTFTDKYGNTVRLKGEPTAPDELWDFGGVRQAGTISTVTSGDDALTNFFIDEGVPDEISQAYLHAVFFNARFTIAKQLLLSEYNVNNLGDLIAKKIAEIHSGESSDSNIHITTGQTRFDTDLIVTRNGKDIRYQETGISYDSFFKGLCEVYTEESAALMMENSETYYEYGGAVWYAEPTGKVNNNSSEYSLVRYTDTEFVFSATYERFASFEEYNFPYTLTVEHSLVKTDDGWRLVWSPYLMYDIMY